MLRSSVRRIRDRVRLRTRLRRLRDRARRIGGGWPPRWTGPMPGAAPPPRPAARSVAQLELAAESVGWLRRYVAGPGALVHTGRLTVAVEQWRAPYPDWSGCPARLPRLVRYELNLPPGGSGRITVAVVLARPQPLPRIVAALLPVLEPVSPVPVAAAPDIGAHGVPPAWLRPGADVDDRGDVGGRDRADGLASHDVCLAATEVPPEPGHDAVVRTGPAGVAALGDRRVVLVDATAANPRGRDRYGPDLPGGRLSLVAAGDGPWWQITRAGREGAVRDGAVRDGAVIVTGRVGEVLDERQAGALAGLGAVGYAPAGPGAAPGGTEAAPEAEATTLAQLAMTGVVLHTAPLSSATRALLAPELSAVVQAPLPPAADELEWDVRGVRQRREALRHHAAEVALRRLAAGHYPALARPPAVSALLVSRRPELVVRAATALAAQTYPELELVVCGHGGELGPEQQRDLAALPRPVRLVAAPAGFTLGEALAEATRHASGSLLTKVDDDDRYGPEHVWDLVLARHYSGATVVGKGAEFVHVEPGDVTVRRRMGAECYTDVVAGGTILLGRGDLEAAGGWRPVARSVDRALLDRVLRAGGLIYRTHGLGFIYSRHGAGHTWRTSPDYFLRDPRQRWDGLLRHEEFGTR